MADAPTPTATGGARLGPPIGKADGRGTHEQGVAFTQTQAYSPSAEEIARAIMSLQKPKRALKPYVPPKGLLIGEAYQTVKSGQRYRVAKQVDCFPDGSIITINDLREYRHLDADLVNSGDQDDININRLLGNGHLVKVFEDETAQAPIEMFLPAPAAQSA